MSKETEALTKMGDVVKRMAKDLVLGDVLEAYDATERALASAQQYGEHLPTLDLVFRLRGVHEQLFRVRADLEES